MERLVPCAIVMIGAGCGRIFDPAPTSTPPDFVQVGFNFTTDTSLSVSFEKPIGSGNTIVIALDVFGPETAAVTAVTDTLGNHFTVLGPFDSSVERHYLAYAEDTVPGTDAITAAVDTAASLELYIHEYSGLAPAASLDAVQWANGSSLAVDGMQSGFATTTAPVEVVFAFAECTSGTCASGTGFTLRSHGHGNVTEDHIVTSIGSYQAVATSLDSATWTIVMATFRAR
jgi:hypothetical protein